MRISDNEIKKILHGETAVVHAIVEIGEEVDQRVKDAPMVKRLSKEIINAPDREEMVAELKARIDAGTYNPTGDEIADAMIRRNIADSVR